MSYLHLFDILTIENPGSQVNNWSGSYTTPIILLATCFSILADWESAINANIVNNINPPMK